MQDNRRPCLWRVGSPFDSAGESKTSASGTAVIFTAFSSSFADVLLAAASDSLRHSLNHSSGTSPRRECYAKSCSGETESRCPMRRQVGLLHSAPAGRGGMFHGISSWVSCSCRVSSMSRPRGQGRGFLFALRTRCERGTRPQKWCVATHPNMPTCLPASVSSETLQTGQALPGDLFLPDDQYSSSLNSPFPP